MKRVRFTAFILILGVVVSSHMLYGQNQDSIVYDNAKKIKEGLLIVRLDMKTSVIDTYKEVVENPNLTVKERQRAEKKLLELSEGRKAYKANFEEAMKNHYSFSDYCFLESKNVKSFYGGDHSTLECPSEVDLDNLSEDYIFFLIKGKTDSHLIITDYALAPIAYPFPSSYNIGVKRLFDFFAKRDNFSIENLSKTIYKMQDRLNKIILNKKALR